MIDVAKAKAILGSAIEDLPREERVLDAAVAGIRRAAQRAGSSPPEDQAVRRLYRAQIEAAKTIQRRWTREQSPLVTDERNPETARRALDEEIRPALIYLGDRLADLLVRVLDQNAVAPTREDLRQALDRHALPEEDLDALTKALEGLLTN